MNRILLLVITVLCSLSVFAQNGNEDKLLKAILDGDQISIPEKYQNPNADQYRWDSNEDYESYEKRVTEFRKQSTYPSYPKTGNVEQDDAIFLDRKEKWESANQYFPVMIESGDDKKDRAEYFNTVKQWKRSFPDQYREVYEFNYGTYYQ